MEKNAFNADMDLINKYKDKNKYISISLKYNPIYDKNMD